MIDINLLPSRDIEHQKDLKTKFYAILVISVATIITLAMVFGLTGFKSYQDSQIANLELRKTTATNTLGTLTKRASDLLTLKKKAKGIVTVAKNTYDFKSAFAYATSLLPPEVEIQKVEIDDKGMVSLTLTGGNKEEIASYIAKVAEDQEFKDSKLSKLSVTEEGVIVFNVGGLYGQQ